MVHQTKRGRKGRKFRLYTNVRTSVPLDLERLAEQLNASGTDEIRIQIPGPLPLARVTQRLNDIAADVGRTRADKKVRRSVRELANECAIAVTQVRLVLQELQSPAPRDAQFVAHAMESFGDLEAAWHRMNVTLALEDAVDKQQRSAVRGRRNLDRGREKRNAKLKAQADADVLSAFREWDKRLANTSVTLSGKSFKMRALKASTRVERYIKYGSAKPSKRARARLRAMASEGLLK